MTPESEKILKKVTKALETEHDPDRREMLMVHKERFERLKAMSEKRNALSASRMPTPSEPEELRHPAREPVQNRPVGVQKFLLGLIGLFAPLSFTADAHMRTELKRNGVDPAHVPPEMIKELAEHAIEISKTADGVDRVTLAMNIAGVARQMAPLIHSNLDTEEKRK